MSTVRDTPLATSPPLGARAAAGDLIDHRYRLVRMLGRGGMGEVWQAQHATLDRAVALKLVRVDTHEMRAQLLREARVLARLRHPAIVTVHDAGVTAEGMAYLAMDVLVGESLAQRIGRGRLEVTAGVELFVEVLGGLEAAHAAGVVHRDIKPDNVLLVQRDGRIAPTLIDFGIAIPAGSAPISAGTPEYMSPEQLRGQPCDARTDVWASCVSLYETVTGRAPFFGSNLQAIAGRVFEGSLAYPTDVPALDGKLWSILTHGLRKEPEDRIATAHDLRTALTGWLARGTTPRVASPLDALVRQKLTGR